MDGFQGALPRTRQTPVGLEQRLALRLRGAGFAVGAPLVVGFSGGTDSLALAAAFARVREPGRRIVLAHVDHGLRPDSADHADAANALAATLGLPFRACRIAGEPRSLHPGLGVEEAARRERYRLLAAIVRGEGAAALALAHHRDDQAETVLLHVLRGAGTSGAAAMAETVVRPVPWWDDPEAGPWPLTIWRPLIAEPRAELAAYVSATGLAPLHDPTNDDPAFRRNLVRHEVLPALEQVWPGAAAALSRHAALAAEDDALLSGMAAAVLAEARVHGGLLAARVSGEPPAIARRVIRAWLVDNAPGLEISAERTDAVFGLLDPGRGGRRIDVGQGWTAIGRSGMIRLERRTGGEDG